MSQANGFDNGVESPSSVLAELVDRLTTRMQAGESVRWHEVLAQHPEHADELRRLLPALGALDRLSGSGSSGLSGLVSASDLREGGVPETLGDFRILGELGRGGMGIVYQAEQISLRRPVALKVLPAAATLDPRHRQRFHNEAQAAASLQHPHIVPVHAVGCERGIPYYAMQLICGLPLTAIIQQQQTRQQSAAAASSLTADQSLASTSDGSAADSPSRSDITTAYTPSPVTCAPSALLDAEVVSSAVPSGVECDYFRWVAQVGVQAAEALDHAHQMGVVHRDIKPSNLLLDSKGQVWITDFGLAMMRHQESSLTQSGDIIGTIRYMSPEQALAQRAVLDHRTDVYSLGATLYELLALQPAFVSTERQELLRQVISDEPARLRALRRSIPVDLETIVLKAMEKRPQDRYGTAQELADDLKQFLSDQPIRARRPGLQARMARWGRRNRGWVAAVAGALVLGLVLSTLVALVYGEQQRQLADARQAQVEAEERERRQAEQYAEQMAAKAETERQAKEKERQAKEQAQRAREAEREAKNTAQKRLRQITQAKELLEGIFNALDPTAESKGGPGLQEQLKLRVLTAAGQLDGELVGDPLTMADLQSALGHTLGVLGEPLQAIRLCAQARATRQAQLGPEHPLTLQSMNNLAWAYREAGQLDKALPLFEQTLAQCKEKRGPDHPHTLITMNNLATAYQDAGQLDKALPLLEQTLAKRKEKLDSDHPNTLHSMNNLALAYQAAGQLDKALPLFEQTLAKGKAKLGSDHPDTLLSMHNLALACKAAGRLDRALPLLEQTLAKSQAKLGRDHPDTLLSMHNLAVAYREAGQLERALPLFEQTLAIRQAKLGSDHPDTLPSMNNLAVAYADAGQWDKALPLLEQTLAKMKAKLGGDHPITLNGMNSLALAYREAGQLERALPLFEQTLAKRKEKLGSDHPDTLVSMNNLAAAYRRSGHLDRSIPLFEELLPRMRKKLGPDHPDTLQTQATLGVTYRDSGRLDKGLPLLEEAFQRAQAGSLDRAPQLAWIRPTLAESYERAGQLAKAEKLHRQILEQAQQQDKDSPQTATFMAVLGLNFLKQKKYAQAEPLLRQCLALREKKQPGAWTTFNIQSMLGGALLGQKKYTQAEPLLTAGYQGMKEQEGKIPPQGKVRLTEAAERLVHLYEATGNKPEAARWHKVLEQLRAAHKPSLPGASNASSRAGKAPVGKP